MLSITCEAMMIKVSIFNHKGLEYGEGRQSYKNILFFSVQKLIY